MKNIISFIILIVLWTSHGSVLASDDKGYLNKDFGSLIYCVDEELGVRMLCDKDWSLREGREALLLVVNSDPAVTITIVKIKDNVKLIDQVTNKQFVELGEYRDNFAKEFVLLGGERSVKIKGFSRKFPEMRLADYYVVHSGKLYGLLFSVDPMDEWDKYKFLFKKVADSFSFIE